MQGHSTNEYSIFGLDSMLGDTTVASFTLFLSLALKKKSCYPGLAVSVTLHAI